MRAMRWDRSDLLVSFAAPRHTQTKYTTNLLLSGDRPEQTEKRQREREAKRVKVSVCSCENSLSSISVLVWAAADQTRFNQANTKAPANICFY